MLLSWPFTSSERSRSNSESKNIPGPRFAELHYSAGLAFYNLRRYREAAQELKTGHRPESKACPGHFRTGPDLPRTGDREGAEQQQAALESLDPVYAAKIAKLLAMKSDPQRVSCLFSKLGPKPRHS